MACDDRRPSAVAVPAALLFAVLLHALGLGDIFLILFGGTFHEAGHALAAWLGGRWAFFVPFGFTMTGGSRSPLIALLFFGGAAGFAVVCLRERCFGAALGCAALIGGMGYLCLRASTKEWEMWMVFAGCAGELVLSAALVLGFYYRLPDVLRWDFWRYPLMFIAAVAFVESFMHWQNMDPDLRGQVFGDAVTSSKEYDNDMVRLVSEHHWTAQQLIRAYRGIGLAGLAAIAAHSLWFLGRGAWPARTAEPSV